MGWQERLDKRDEGDKGGMVECEDKTKKIVYRRREVESL